VRVVARGAWSAARNVVSAEKPRDLEEDRMTTKADYTPEEWTALVRSPFVAGAAISFADPGGPIELVKETGAVLKTITQPSADQPELVAAAKAELSEMAGQRKNPLADFKPKGPGARQQVLDELRSVSQTLAAKATPEEAAAFRAWLLKAAQDAANAAKEGGFMGIGATRVSEGEQQMLDELAKLLGD
jgi:hypothetical protein